MNPNNNNLMTGYPSYMYNQNYPSLTQPDETTNNQSNDQ
jgi:hypothetical protein